MIKNILKVTRTCLLLQLILLLGVSVLIVSINSVIRMPGVSYKGSLEPGTRQEKIIQANLEKHVQMLAGIIGPRNSPQSSSKTREYIVRTMSSYGYTVEAQGYVVDNNKFTNLQAKSCGSRNPTEIILVGAHYDTFGGSPGADDNGSGVATVLELARLNAGVRNPCTIRFVFFGSEEPPYFGSNNMGSYQYAERCFQRKENIKGLLVMETLGYYSEKPKSQAYPCNFVPGYPDAGNFIAFVGNLDSRKLTEQCLGSFRESCHFPSEGIAAPDWIIGVDWSDQYWFWKRHYPALMITDTAPYRYPYYHSIQDTPDKLNYPSFARVVTGLSNVLHVLAQ